MMHTSPVTKVWLMPYQGGDHSGKGISGKGNSIRALGTAESLLWCVQRDVGPQRGWGWVRPMPPGQTRVLQCCLGFIWFTARPWRRIPITTGLC